MDSGFRLVVYCCLEFIVTYVPSRYMPCMCVQMSHKTMHVMQLILVSPSMEGERSAYPVVGESWLTYVDSTYDGFTVRHVIHRATSFFSSCLVHLVFCSSTTHSTWSHQVPHKKICQLYHNVLCPVDIIPVGLNIALPPQNFNSQHKHCEIASCVYRFHIVFCSPFSPLLSPS